MFQQIREVFPHNRPVRSKEIDSEAGEVCARQYVRKWRVAAVSEFPDMVSVLSNAIQGRQGESVAADADSVPYSGAEDLVPDSTDKPWNVCLVQVQVICDQLKHMWNKKWMRLG